MEFLNQQMDPAEVLALELRQFEGEGLKTLVPVVYGQTEEAQQKKRSTGLPKRQWDEASIYEDIERRVGPEATEVAKKIAAWMKANGDEVSFGSGRRDGSMQFMVMSKGRRMWPLALRSNGKVEVSFGYLMRSPLMDEEKRRELLKRLNQIDGISLPTDAITKYPAMPIAALSDERRLSAFLAAMEWVDEQLRAG